MPSDLARATAVSRLANAPGWYVADLPNDWSYLTPSGGVLMAVAMRAMAAELGDEELLPVAATTLFCSPVPCGPIEIRVEVLRRGNAAAQARAALSSTTKPGPGLEVSATFARARPGHDALGIAMPAVPPPLTCPDAGQAARRRSGRREHPFFENVDARLAAGPPVWDREGWSASDARLACWYRYAVRQHDAAGKLHFFAIPPIADTMPGALAARLGPGAEPFFAPSLDLTVHFLDASPAEWFLVDVRCQRARAGYATADADIWDEEGRLLARATQTMMLRKR